MTIRWTLAELAEKQKHTGYSLAALTGISRQTLYKLMREPVVTRIDTETLDALCVALKCQPGKLLRHD